MHHFQQPPSVTVQNLRKARDFLSSPGLWHQGGTLAAYSADMVGACYLAGVCPFPTPESQKLPDGVVKPGLPRGSLQEEIWFLRQAILYMDPHSDGTIARWNDAPERKHSDVLAAFDLAIELAAVDASDQCVTS